MMSIVLLLPFLLAVESGTETDVIDRPADEENIFSYAFGKQYGSKLTKEMIAKCPSWDGKSDNPPLPAGKAIRVAETIKSKLVKDNDDATWRLVSATLQCAQVGKDNWLWVVTYEARSRRPVAVQSRNALQIVVLMDGTVIEPTVSDD